jgi:CTP synthase (UTP-ammonia lyase)
MVIDCVNSIDHDCMSTEWNVMDVDNIKIPIIDLQQPLNGILGETIRLDNYETCLDLNSYMHKLYNKECITKRQRHLYEVTRKYVHLINSCGLLTAGKDKY